MKNKDFKELVNLLKSCNDAKVTYVSTLYYEEIGNYPTEDLVIISGGDKVFVIQGGDEDE